MSSRKLLLARKKLWEHKEFFEKIFHGDFATRKALLKKASKQQLQTIRTFLRLVVTKAIPIAKKNFQAIVKSKLRPFLIKNFSQRDRFTKSIYRKKILKICGILPYLLEIVFKQPLKIPSNSS